MSKILSTCSFLRERVSIMLCSACGKEAKYLSHFGDCSDGAYCEQCAMDKFVADKSQFCYCMGCSGECSSGTYFFEGHSFCSTDCIKDYIDEHYLEDEIDLEDIDSLEKIKFCDCLYCGCSCKNGVYWYDYNSYCSLDCIMRANDFWTIEDIEEEQMRTPYICGMKLMLDFLIRKLNPAQ